MPDHPESPPGSGRDERSVPEPNDVPSRTTIEVELVYARANQQHVVSLHLATGATVADALQAVAATPPFDTLDLSNVPTGIFGDRVERGRVLENGDRLEIYRPLIIDPREARRQRARAERRRSGGV
jgi:putative ubiquitin-RnfH superfamily antitoxin RatB of RatAB toxin-antitoxin module